MDDSSGPGQASNSIAKAYSSNVLLLANYQVDFGEAVLKKPDGTELTISRKPLRMLEILVLNRERYLSNAELHAIFSNHTETVDAATRQHIKKLRDLFDDEKKEKLITRPLGYKLILPVTVPVEFQNSYSEPASEPSDAKDAERERYVEPAVAFEKEKGSLKEDKREINKVAEPQIEYEVNQSYQQSPANEVVDSNKSAQFHNANRKSIWRSDAGRLIFWTATVFGILSSGLLLSAFNEPDSNERPEFNLAETPYKALTHLPGLEFYPSASPDGKWIAFNHLQRDRGQWRIYLKDMKTEELLPLTDGQTKDKYPRWSLDGKRLTFTRLSEGQCSLMGAKFDIEQRQLIDISVLKTCNPESFGAQAVMWKNNRGMFYIEESDYGSPGTVYSYDFSAGTKWQATSPEPTDKGDYFIQLSNLGNQLAVLRSLSDVATEIWVYDTQTWENRLVKTVHYSLFRVDWAANDGSLIYKNDQNQVVQVYLGDQEEEVVLASVSLPFYSPTLLHGDQEQIVVVLGSPFGSQVFQRDLNDALLLSSESALSNMKVSYLTNDKLDAKEKLVGAFGINASANANANTHANTDANTSGLRNNLLFSSSFSEKRPVISPDGSTIAWVSSRGRIPQLRLREEDGSERKLTELERFTDFSSLTFSPDGQHLGGTADGLFFVFDFEHEELRWSQQDEPYYSDFQWRADSNQFFVTESKGGHSQVIRGDINAMLIGLFEPLAGAEAIIESFDGRFLYSWNNQNKRIVRFDTTTQEKYALNITSDMIGTNRWAMTNGGLFIARQLSDQNQLIYLNHDKDHAVVIDENFPSHQISLPADAGSVIYSERSNGDTELVTL